MRKTQDIEMSGGAHSGYRPRATVGHSWDERHGFVVKMTEGLSARISGAAPSPMGREAVSMSLPEIAMACARNMGLRPAAIVEAVRMAATHTGSDFPLILEKSLTNVAGRRLRSLCRRSPPHRARCRVRTTGPET